MKVLLINGSPHRDGCTYTALREVERTLQEQNIDTEICWIGNKAMGGCIACHKCSEIGKCVFNDIVNEIHEKAKEADGFVFGTPVHYAGASGNMTAFMDRLFYSELGGCQNKNFRLKPAACVMSARRAGTTATYDQMNKYFAIQEMPIITTKYWNMVHGAIPEQVIEDKEGLMNMRILGRNMAFHLKCKEIAMNSGLELPEEEPAVFTNFVR